MGAVYVICLVYDKSRTNYWVFSVKLGHREREEAGARERDWKVRNSESSPVSGSKEDLYLEIPIVVVGNEIQSNQGKWTPLTVQLTRVEI